MFAAFDPSFIFWNRVEAVFWIVIALAMSIAAMRQRGSARIDCIIAAATFALFGLSDLVETTTGAWWRPWWLLAWKGACVATFLILLLRYMHSRTRVR